MKIKKKTSFMLLAASTAAVVGVAAVSFAAWTNERTSLSVQASTGDIYYVGFEEEASLTIGSKNLVPYNQPTGSYDASANDVVVSIKVPDFKVYEAYTLTIKAYSEYSETSKTQTTLPLYANYGAQVTASEVEAWTAIPATGWTSLAGGGALTTPSATPESAMVAVAGQYINIVLNSEDYDDSTTTFHIEVVLTHNPTTQD